VWLPSPISTLQLHKKAFSREEQFNQLNSAFHLKNGYIRIVDIVKLQQLKTILERECLYNLVGVSEVSAQCSVTSFLF